MAKVYTYIMIAIGLMFLMKYTGIPTAIDSALVWLGISSTISDVSIGAFAIAIGVFLSTALAAGITIGFLTKSSVESLLIAPLAFSLFALIVATFVSIITYTSGLGDSGWVGYLFILILTPFTIGYMISIVEWWRGAD